MKLTWFGHSAVRAENGDHVILIDPFLSGNPKFGGSVEDAARGATHVVLTHGHDDHVGDSAEICKERARPSSRSTSLRLTSQARAFPNMRWATPAEPSILAATSA